MLRITPELLARAYPSATAARTETFAPHLEEARYRYVGEDPRHVAMWLAQLAHESGSLRYVREIASGEAYEGRKDLGNVNPGDGMRFRGRGLIQITGRSNYAEVSDALGINFVLYPEVLEEPKWAALSAGWFWRSRKCDQAMTGNDPDAVIRVTKIINGGTNGLSERAAHYRRILPLCIEAAKEVAQVGEGEVQENPAAKWPWPDPTNAPLPLVGSTTDGSAQPVIQAQGKPMAPFVLAALPEIVKAIPSLVRIFGNGSEVSERNAQAAEKVADIVTSATGAANVQDAVAKLQASPEARQAATKVIEASWYDLVPHADEASTASARKFSIERGERVVVLNLTFIELLSLVLVVISAGGGLWLALAGKLTEQLLGAVVTLMLIGGYTGVKEFWLGSSRDSQRKTEMLGR